MRVAGIQVPAFVERNSILSPPPTRRRTGVAGIQVPAFVERRRLISSWAGYRVSPGFRSRPSLSAPLAVAAAATTEVSPGFRSRPSLSGLGFRRRDSALRSVAGIQVPAIVELGAAPGTPTDSDPGTAEDACAELSDAESKTSQGLDLKAARPLLRVARGNLHALSRRPHGPRDRAVPRCLRVGVK